MGKQYRQHYGMDDFTEEETFVFDTGAFNFLMGKNNLLRRLKAEDFSETARTIYTANYRALLKDIKAESTYLHNMADNIRNEKNRVVPEEVVQELQAYYRKLGKTIEEIENIVEGARWEIYPFLGGIADVVCACQNYGVYRAKAIMASDESKKRFEKYLEWLEEIAELQGCAAMHEACFEESYISGEIQEREVSLHIPDRTRDNRIIALSLANAWQQPTILFTSDFKHVGKIVRLMYGYEKPETYYPIAPEIPPNRHRVFVGFEKGWELKSDSLTSPP